MLRLERRPVSGWVWMLSALLPLGGVALAVTLGGMTQSAWRWIVVAAGALAVAGLLRVPSTARSDLTPAYTVAAALPFITKDATSIFDPAGLGTVLAIGLSLLWVIRTARGDDQRDVFVWFVRRSMAFSAYVATAVWADASIPIRSAGSFLADWHDAVSFVLASLAAFVIELLFSGVARRMAGELGRTRASFITAGSLDVFISLVATGALFGLAFEAVEWWALAVATLPYAFAHGAFRRFQAAKTTYRQTIRALARIPEVGGHTDDGHAHRTAELATAVAADLGLRSSEIENIEFAALLHDIGRVTLNEPSILRMGFTENDIARWGAEIVGETAYLRDVAEIVRRQHEPYRSPGEDHDPDVPLPARVVKVASAYDESTSELGFSPLEAMERLHRGSVYDYDPDIVGALRKLLERAGTFSAHPVTK